MTEKSYPDAVIEHDLTKMWDVTYEIHGGDEDKFDDWLNRALGYVEDRALGYMEDKLDDWLRTESK